MTTIALNPNQQLPYFAALPYYLWGEINYDSEGDCKSPIDRNWTQLHISNRENTKQYFDITVKDGQLKIEGDSDSVKKLCNFFTAKKEGKEGEGEQDEEGMKRVNVVNYCFEHPAVQKFAQGHSFWGSWKWVGPMATEFTYVGRWIMMDAMRNSPQGAWVAADWMRTTGGAQKKALMTHLSEVCEKPESGSFKFSKEKYPEPDADKWEAELLDYYKTLLEKFDCLTDKSMLRLEEKDDDEGEDEGIEDAWSAYGIDITSGSAMKDFKKMGMPFLQKQQLKESCTFDITEDVFTVQPAYICSDCFPNDETAGVCQYCAEECKKQNHKVSDPRYVPFFCDKGALRAKKHSN